MSLWLNTKRVIRYGMASFLRNGFISLSAIFIMSLTLFTAASLLVASAALKTVLNDLTQKVDITVYFTPAAPDDQVTQLQQSLRALPEVASIRYISRDAALAAFQARHQNDQLTLQALQEIGENPLGASLEIQAKQPSQYESIAHFLSAQQSSGSGAGGIIDKINYSQNKTAIDRLTNIVDAARRFGLAVALIMGLASLLITFNTIRLAIYTARDEIGVMNLVGAGQWYVRGPFMVAGILYGVVSGAIVLFLLWPLAVWLGPASERFLGVFNVYAYYVDMFPLLFLLIMAMGIVLGALSSYLAVRRYLK